MSTREQIYSALWQRVSSVSNFATASRKLVGWNQLSETSQLPALFMNQSKEEVVVLRGLPAYSKLMVDFFVYAHTDTDSGTPAGATLSALVDAIQTALAPDLSSGEQTLGGIVSKCRVMGTIETHEGALDDAAVAIIPIEITAWPNDEVTTPAGGPVASVTLSATGAVLRVDTFESAQIVVTVLDAGAQPLSGRSVIYASSNPAVATVSSTGIVRAIAAGTATITVSCEGIAAVGDYGVVGYVGAFDPSKLRGLKAWLVGDVGVTLNGSNASVWTDQGPNAKYHATQPTAAKQPIGTGVKLNGRNVISFDGASQGMKWGLAPDSPQLYDGGAYSMGIVYRTPGGAPLSYSTLVRLINNGLGFAQHMYFEPVAGGDPIVIYTGGGGAGVTTFGTAVTDATDTGAHQMIVMWDGSAMDVSADTPNGLASWYIYKDSVLKTLARSTFSSNIGGTALLSSLGASVTFSNTVNAFLQCDIAEVYLYDRRELAVHEVLRLQQYNAAGWGVA